MPNAMVIEKARDRVLDRSELSEPGRPLSLAP
jgi:hypothetical protein